MAIKLKDFLDLVHKRISMMLKILLLIGAILLFLAEQYQAAAETLLILFVTFLPLILGNRFKVRIPHEFESLAILFICLSLFFGEVLDFYNRYWWWDTMLHTGAGFLLGILGFLLVYVLNENERIQLQLSPAFIALFACMFAISIGVLWEIFEYFMDQTFGMNMQKNGLHDTMLDLMVDTIGAVIISVMGYGYLKTRDRDSFLERFIDRFIAANPHFFGKDIEPDDIETETKKA